jgi:hypothetical protein
MHTKICTCCKKEKELTIEFFSIYNKKMRDGSYKKYFRIYCKECKRAKDRQRNINNPEYMKNYNALETTKQKKKEWQDKNYNYEDKKEYCHNYYETHKEEIKKTWSTPEFKERKRIYKRNRRKNDPIFRMRENISNAILKALRKSKSSKGGQSILQYLEYTINQLKEHLEKQFDDKMNWENYGIYWHIDHIIPQSILPYSSMQDENFKKCWSLSNLRPLDAKTNILEGVKRTRHKLYLEGDL